MGAVSEEAVTIAAKTEIAAAAAAALCEAHQADTSPNPGAMMVKLLHAVVAHGTVGAAGGPPMAACGAKLGLDNIPVDLVILVPWSRPA